MPCLALVQLTKLCVILFSNGHGAMEAPFDYKIAIAGILLAFVRIDQSSGDLYCALVMGTCFSGNGE